MWETQVQSLGWEVLLEKGMASSSSSLTWEIHGQRSLAGYIVHRVTKGRTCPSDFHFFCLFISCCDDFLVS